MSKIEVNTVDVASGSTLTLGSSGKTITIPAGATISNAGTSSGFGGSGAVSWETTPKTSTFTGATGVGYFVNTSGGAVTLNLPAGSAGNIIAVADYTRTFQTNSLTITPNGTQKIGGIAGSAILSVEGQSATFIFVDSTEGWINVQNAEDTEEGLSPFLEATGGTITTVDTNFKVHTFTSPGTFNVTNAGTSGGSNTVSYMVIAGGGAGGNASSAVNGFGGGGGAGGFREGRTSTCSYAVSPLNAPAGLPVSVQGYSIAIGAGGADAGAPGSPGTGNVGSVSTFSSITSAGGGGGMYNGNDPGANGGSGGGRGNDGPTSGGTGNTPPTSPAQGTNGGSRSPNAAGGGGGATAVGVNGATGGPAGAGGAGATTTINGTPTARAGGGGGGGNCGETGGGAGGASGGGAGGNFPASPGTNGTANTGGGGGATSAGNSSPLNAGVGGSGIVIIRYKFQ